MDFASGSLPLVLRDGTKKTLVWEKGNGDIRPEETVTMIVPVRDRRSGPSLNLRIEVYRNGSLESAGRRVALFTRLMGEHEIAGLKPKT